MSAHRSTTTKIQVGNESNGAFTREEIETTIALRAEQQASSGKPFELVMPGRTLLFAESTYGPYRVVRIRNQNKGSDKQKQRRIELQETVDSIIESLPTGVAYYDSMDRLQVWNRLYEKGMPLQRGKTYTQLYTEWANKKHSTSEEIREAIKSGLANHKTLATTEFVSNGREYTNSRRRTNSGGTIMLVHDVTEIRQHEKALEKINIELEQANADLELFARAAAHDLNSPLRALSGYATVLLEDFGQILDQEAFSIVERIKESALRANKLLDALSEFIHSPLNEASAETLNLEEFTAEIKAEFAKELAGSGTQIQVTGANTIEANALVTVALRNLIGNALKYRSKDQKPKITVDAFQDAQQTEIAVVDNGIGIDKVHHQEIFRPFKRLHNYSEYQGSGLGLATVERICQVLGGNISVHSVLDQGSTFTLSIPR